MIEKPLYNPYIDYEHAIERLKNRKDIAELNGVYFACGAGLIHAYHPDKDGITIYMLDKSQLQAKWVELNRHIYGEDK